MRKIILSPEIISKIIDLYQSGISCPKIGKQFGFSGEYIRTLLKNNDIIARKYYEINRKHKVNECLFDHIDTQEKAYFLGLLFADGNVHSKYNSIVIKLQQEDKPILLKLSYLIFSKELLYKSEDNYVLKFSSYYVKQRLIQLGCIPNKSLKISFPQIDNNLHSHFIRGYFDGDGSIYEYRNDFGINMVSTEDFCDGIFNILLKNTGIEGVISKDKTMLERGNNITSILSYAGNRRVQKILDWLYKDATIYMERKYQKYLELKAWTENVDSRKNSTERHINQYV
jgi:intein-encoded DNA endonuclease-like protein